VRASLSATKQDGRVEQRDGGQPAQVTMNVLGRTQGIEGRHEPRQ
jgi:hypothetical protein